MNESRGDRFFRAMVLMGSSMALGCGGTTSRNGGSPDSAGGAGGAGGSGGSGPGGSGTGGSGGIFIPVPSTDSGVSTTGSVDPGPFPCVPAQWDCSSTPPACSNAYDGWQLPDECACSDARPKSAADCASGQSFVCQEATERWDGVRYTESVPFQCSCVEHDSNCQVECAAAGFDWDPSCRQAFGEGGAAGAPVVETLCGCAIVVLR